jgi:hypothetical protein
MSFFSDKRKRKIFIITSSVVLALALVLGACAIYLGDYYRADYEAIDAFMPQGTTWKEEPDGTIVFQPEDATRGLIFYPGGKVEYSAYVPLMQACSENGILCVLVEMPFNLAVHACISGTYALYRRARRMESCVSSLKCRSILPCSISVPQMASVRNTPK